MFNVSDEEYAEFKKKMREVAASMARLDEPPMARVVASLTHKADLAKADLEGGIEGLSGVSDFADTTIE